MSIELQEIINTGIGVIGVILVFMLKRFINSVDDLRNAIGDLRLELAGNKIQIQTILRELNKQDKRITNLEEHRHTLQ